ncbi:MAG: hypothetical protein ACREMF_03500, partial [Gemmatimonadales bacterium]
SGGAPTPAEQAMLRQVFAQGRRGSGGAGSRPGALRAQDFGGRFIVFVLRDGKPAPVQIRTGLTDLDYVEVVTGLTEQDTVLVLPSASLVNAQRQFQQRIQTMTGGGGIPGMRQQQTAPAR